MTKRAMLIGLLLGVGLIAVLVARLTNELAYATEPPKLPANRSSIPHNPTVPAIAGPPVLFRRSEVGVGGVTGAEPVLAVAAGQPADENDLDEALRDVHAELKRRGQLSPREAKVKESLDHYFAEIRIEQAIRFLEAIKNEIEGTSEGQRAAKAIEVLRGNDESATVLQPKKKARVIPIDLDEEEVDEDLRDEGPIYIRHVFDCFGVPDSSFIPQKRNNCN